MKARADFFEKINEIAKTLSHSLKERETQINKLKNERGEITMTITEIQKIIKPPLLLNHKFQPIRFIYSGLLSQSQHVKKQEPLRMHPGNGVVAVAVVATS